MQKLKKLSLGALALLTMFGAWIKTFLQRIALKWAEESYETAKKDSATKVELANVAYDDFSRKYAEYLEERSQGERNVQQATDPVRKPSKQAKRGNKQSAGGSGAGRKSSKAAKSRNKKSATRRKKS